MGNMLMQAYQVFQTEVGLGGKIFRKPFRSLGRLATHGFFQNLWELLDLFGVSLRIHNIFDIPLLRVNDRMIMDAVVETDIFTARELDQVNRVRHYKKVTTVADLACCDGSTIKSDLYNSSAGRSHCEFPIQQPTPGDFVVWKKAIGLITRPGNRLVKSLGNYISTPHTPDEWFINNIRTKIYHKTPTGSYEQYVLRNPHCTTRYGAFYIRCQQATKSPSLERRLTPRLWTDDKVRYHSSWPATPTHSNQTTATIRNTMESQENQSLWTNLRMDGVDDREWIYTGLINGTLEIGHDGSYQPELANNICAGATVIHCPQTGNFAELTWVEKSDRKTATNYRGEILGAIATQLLIK